MTAAGDIGASGTYLPLTGGTMTGTIRMGFNTVFQPTITGGRLGSQLTGNGQSIANVAFIGSLTHGNLELLASGGAGTFLKLNFLNATGVEQVGLAIETGVDNPAVSIGPTGSGNAHLDMENNAIVGIEALTGSPDGPVTLTSSGGHPLNIDTATGAPINLGAVVFPVQASTAEAPPYVKGGMYFDTTLNKLRIGGASGWETVTSLGTA